MALSFDDPTNVPVTVAVVGKYTTQANTSLFLNLLSNTLTLTLIFSHLFYLAIIFNLPTNPQHIPPN